jgi:hypothetical protein
MLPPMARRDTLPIAPYRRQFASPAAANTPLHQCKWHDTLFNLSGKTVTKPLHTIQSLLSSHNFFNTFKLLQFDVYVFQKVTIQDISHKPLFSHNQYINHQMYLIKCNKI